MFKDSSVLLSCTRIPQETWTAGVPGESILNAFIKFIQQIFTEYSLAAGHCSRQWGHNKEQDRQKMPPFMELDSSGGDNKSIHQICDMPNSGVRGKNKAGGREGGYACIFISQSGGHKGKNSQAK